MAASFCEDATHSMRLPHLIGTYSVYVVVADHCKSLTIYPQGSDPALSTEDPNGQSSKEVELSGKQQRYRVVLAHHKPVWSSLCHTNTRICGADV